MKAGCEIHTRVVADLTSWNRPTRSTCAHLLDLAMGHGPLEPTRAVRPEPGRVAVDFATSAQAVAAMLDWVETLEAASIDQGAGSRLGGGYVCVVAEEPGPADSVLPGLIDLATQMVMAMTGPDEVLVTEPVVVGAGAVLPGGYSVVLDDRCCPLNGEYLYRLDHNVQPGFLARSTLAWARRAVAEVAPEAEVWDDPSGIRRLVVPGDIGNLLLIAAGDRARARAAAGELALHRHGQGTLVLYGYWDGAERRSPLDVAVDALALGFDRGPGIVVPRWSGGRERPGQDEAGLDGLGCVRFAPLTASIVEHLADLHPCMVVLDGVPVDDRRAQAFFEVLVNMCARRDIDVVLIPERDPAGGALLPIVDRHFVPVKVGSGAPASGRAPLRLGDADPLETSGPGATDPLAGLDIAVIHPDEIGWRP